MKEMKARVLAKRGDKGFTLMEMLIVVAIIAVLVAIAIPVFNAQLNKARVETDAANIRSGYAVVSATVLTDENAATSYTLNTDGTVDTGGTAYTTKGDTSATGGGGAQNIAGQSLTWAKGAGVTYTYDATNLKVTITVG